MLWLVTAEAMLGAETVAMGLSFVWLKCRVVVPEVPLAETAQGGAV